MKDTVVVPLVTYALKLQNGKYYVGKSYGLNMRLGQHWSGCGARWTMLHKPVKIVSVCLGDHEIELTIQMMKKHGWQNCRGGPWCRIEMNRPPKCLREDCSSESSS